jgi:SAM-dependent methyltransferase
MNEFTSNENYYDYLTKRSALGLMYRKYYLYPKLNRELSGLTLDVGCGIGDFLQFRHNTIGVDINPKLVDYCRKQGLNAELMHPDALPFKANQFDSVVLDNVIEHIAKPAPLLLEIWRVLKPQGRLLIGVPGSAGYATDPDHKVFFSEQALRQLMQDNGWRAHSVFGMPWRSSWLDANARQYCIYGLFQKIPRQ